MERWATFDCYGTLIDWNSGIRAELARVFGDERADGLLERYHEVEPEIAASTATLSYRQVLTETMRRLGAPTGEEHGLAEALPGWRAFPEVHGALEEAAPPRLEARRPLEHRRRLHRRVAGADRDHLRRGRRRAGDRLVQAGAPALGGVLRADTGAAGRTRARRVRRSSTTSCRRTSSGLRSVWMNRLGESLPTMHGPRASCRTCSRCRRRSMSSSLA